MRIVHFIGSPKPWQASEVSAFQTPVAREHVGQWWDIFINQVLPHLTSDMVRRLSNVSHLPVCFPNFRFLTFVYNHHFGPIFIFLILCESTASSG